MSNDERNPNDEFSNDESNPHRRRGALFDSRHLDFFRHSSFVIRDSRLETPYVVSHNN
jgi:hypothetical protein